jgi:hypothetical protein
MVNDKTYCEKQTNKKWYPEAKFFGAILKIVAGIVVINH